MATPRVVHIDQAPRAPAPARTGTPHTQVPNLLQDLVMPLLDHSERAVLGYIVRRTFGFMDQHGKHKARDRISVSQFTDGITSDEYVLDLGTGLSESAVKRALAKLEDKDLIEVHRHCARCLWEPEDGARVAKGSQCPRCKKSLDKSYAMAPLTPRKMIRFLNENDPQAREWTFDTEAKRFRARLGGSASQEDAHEPGVGSSDDVLGEMAARLWFPELVDTIIGQLEAARARPLTLEQRRQHVLKPVLDLQELAGGQMAPALRYALEETIQRGIASQMRVKCAKGGKTSRQTNFTWWRYSRSILERALAQGFTRSVGVAEPGQARAADASGAVRELLERASRLNRDDEIEAARAVLSELLGMVSSVAEANGGAEIADARIRVAFKKGLSDIASARQAFSLVDYYPEWEWPEGLA